MRITSGLQWLKIAFIGILLLYFAGCSASNDDSFDDEYDNPSSDIKNPDDDTDGIEPEQVIALEKFVSGGQNVLLEVSGLDSPIYGTKIEIPAKAIANGKKEKITISFSGRNYTGLLPDGEAAGKSITVEKSGGKEFDEPVIVTLPIDMEDISENDIISVYSINTETGDYDPVILADIDYVNKEVSFLTSLCSTYEIVNFYISDDMTGSADTGFRPETDGFTEKTSGNGESASEYAVWYFKYRKEEMDEGLFNRCADINTDEDKSLSLFIMEAAEKSHKSMMDSLDPDMSDQYIAKQLIANMKAAGPQILYFGGKPGHAAVVYGYDESKGRFYIYDPNFPGKEASFDWKASGKSYPDGKVSDGKFKNYSENKAYLVPGYSEPDLYDLIPYSIGSSNHEKFTDIHKKAEEYIPDTDSGKPMFSLDVNKTGLGTGLIKICSKEDCIPYESQKFDKGTTVTLTAKAVENSVFTGWSGGGCSGTGECIVLLNKDINLTAKFDMSSIPAELDKYTLTVSKEGEGSGTVKSDAEGISCGQDCDEVFKEGTEITLTASADLGSEFAGWSGGGCSGTGACVVSIDMNTTVKAQFRISDKYSLAISKSGTGTGTVQSYEGGISCGGDCDGEFKKGTEVRLNAVPDQGSEFAGWSGGGCSGTGECVVSLNTDSVVTASFNKISIPTPDNTHTLTVFKDGMGGGSVKSSNIAGISCGLDCTEKFAYAAGVILEAVPDEGSEFTGWSGICTGTGKCVIAMDGDISVTAHFSYNNTSPAVRNLQVPGSVCTNQLFSIAYAYTDPDGIGDVETHYISMSDGTYRHVSSDGTGQFNMNTFSFTQPGSHWVKVYVTDSGGNISNILQKTVSVNNCAGTGSPEVSNLQAAAALCVNVPFSISFNYTDKDGINNVRKNYVLIFRENGAYYDAVTADADLSGRFYQDNFIINSAGTYRIEVYSEDYDGNKSNVLKKSVKVNNCSE